MNVLRRKSPDRVTFSNIDRLVFVELYRLAPGVLDALQLLKPETVTRWHRAGFRAYWRWKSRRRSGRPCTAEGIRQLIREMSIANPLWGAPRIHGELLKLGIDVGQTTVGKCMAKAATLTRLEDLLSQSCRRDCVDGLVRRPNDLVFGCCMASRCGGLAAWVREPRWSNSKPHAQRFETRRASRRPPTRNAQQENSLNRQDLGDRVKQSNRVQP
jgi:hypothetical protein